MDFDLSKILDGLVYQRPEMAGMILIALVIAYVAKKHFGTRREDYKIKMILIIALVGTDAVTGVVWVIRTIIFGLLKLHG